MKSQHEPFFNRDLVNEEKKKISVTCKTYTSLGILVTERKLSLLPLVDAT